MGDDTFYDMNLTDPDGFESKLKNNMEYTENSCISCTHYTQASHNACVGKCDLNPACTLSVSKYGNCKHWDDAE